MGNTVSKDYHQAYVAKLERQLDQQAELLRQALEVVRFNVGFSRDTDLQTLFILRAKAQSLIPALERATEVVE